MQPKTQPVCRKQIHARTLAQGNKKRDAILRKANITMQCTQGNKYEWSRPLFPEAPRGCCFTVPAQLHCTPQHAGLTLAGSASWSVQFSECQKPQAQRVERVMRPLAARRSGEGRGGIECLKIAQQPLGGRRGQHGDMTGGNKGHLSAESLGEQRNRERSPQLARLEEYGNFLGDQVLVGR